MNKKYLTIALLLFIVYGFLNILLIQDLFFIVKLENITSLTFLIMCRSLFGLSIGFFLLFSVLADDETRKGFTLWVALISLLLLTFFGVMVLRQIENECIPKDGVSCVSIKRESVGSGKNRRGIYYNYLSLNNDYTYSQIYETSVVVVFCISISMVFKYRGLFREIMNSYIQREVDLGKNKR